MFKILNRYIGKTVFYYIILTLFGLVSLSSMIKFIDQFRKIGQGEYSVLSAGLYTFLSIPKDISVFFPMATLLGTLIGLSYLTTYNELLVMQSSGLSRIQIAGSVIKIAIPLIFMNISISEWIAPVGEKIARNYRTKMVYGGSVLSTKNGLWIKDGVDFVFIEQVIEKNKLFGVNIYHFDGMECLKTIRYAKNAIFFNDSWKLSQIKKLDLSDNKKIVSKYALNEKWRTNLTPDKLGVVARDYNVLSIAELYKFIKYLQQNGQETNRYQINMWSKIFSPFSIIVMMLLAMSLIFGPFCSNAKNVRIVTGISFCFIFYVLDQVLKSLLSVYCISPIFGTMIPNILFFILSIFIMKISY